MKHPHIHQIINYFLQHKTTHSLRKQFLHWLSSPHLAEEKEDILFEVWSRTNAQFDPSTWKSLDEVLKRINRSEYPDTQIYRYKRSRMLQYVAAVVLFFLGCAISAHHLIPQLRSQAITELTVPAGQYRHITLPDGSKVFINAESTLTYPKEFSGKYRQVTLSGEANFEVKTDPRHPFVVQTEQINVTALGTKFNVHAYQDIDKTSATLEKGSILVSEVANTANSIQLKPNEQTEFDKAQHQFSKRMTDANAIAGWTNGELNFINCTFKDIVFTLRRHFNVPIHTDPRLFTSDLYTIKLRKGENIQRSFKIIALTVGGIKVRHNPDRSISIVYDFEKKKGGA